MVWQEDVYVIAMVTSLLEGEKVSFCFNFSLVLLSLIFINNFVSGKLIQFRRPVDLSNVYNL